jgi:hypothetical protein
VSAVDEKVDLEPIEHLDFEPACDIRVQSIVQIGLVQIPGPVTARCGQPAVVQMRCRGCSKIGLACAEHRDAVLGMPEIFCGTCRAKGAPLMVYEFTPLAGA